MKCINVQYRQPSEGNKTFYHTRCITSLANTKAN